MGRVFYVYLDNELSQDMCLDTDGVHISLRVAWLAHQAIHLCHKLLQLFPQNLCAHAQNQIRICVRTRADTWLDKCFST